MVTLSTLPASTLAMNSLNWTVVSCGPKRAEKFQTATATTTRASQNTRLFNVEFKPCLLPSYRLRPSPAFARLRLSASAGLRRGSGGTRPLGVAYRPSFQDYHGFC